MPDMQIEYFFLLYVADCIMVVFDWNTLLNSVIIVYVVMSSPKIYTNIKGSSCEAQGKAQCLWRLSVAQETFIVV